jgi:uncharacterized membrane protein HdeD (DUF308 family)
MFSQLTSFGWPWLVVSGVLFLAAYVFLARPGDEGRG